MRQGFSSIVNYLTKPPFCQDGNARSSFFQRISHNYPSLIQLFYMLRPRIIFQDAGRAQDFVYFLSNLGEKRPVCGFKKAARRSQPARRQRRKEEPTPKGAAAERLRQTNHAKNKPQKEAGTAPSEACCLVGFCFLRGRLLKFCFAAIPFSVPGRSAPALFTEYTRSSCARRSDSTRTACHSTSPR